MKLDPIKNCYVCDLREEIDNLPDAEAKEDFIQGVYLRITTLFTEHGARGSDAIFNYRVFSVSVPVVMFGNVDGEAIPVIYGFTSAEGLTNARPPVFITYEELFGIKVPTEKEIVELNSLEMPDF